jgi:hypothetical protein
MIGYEFSLIGLGLKNYVFYGPRNDFISANREGFVSSFGYLAVCLFGIEVGMKVFHKLFEKTEASEKEDKMKEQKKREKSVFITLTL